MNVWVIAFIILMSFLCGSWFTCKLITKAVDETLADPNGRWARAFEWMERHYGKSRALEAPLTSSQSTTPTAPGKPLGKSLPLVSTQEKGEE